MPTQPHTILGVSANASEEDIRAAYRRRAAQVHPDVQPAEKKAWAEAQMRELNAARDWLLDPTHRPAQPSAPPPDAYAPPYNWGEPVYNPWPLRRLRQFVAAAGLVVFGVTCLGLALFAPNNLIALVNITTRLIGWVLMFGFYLIAPGFLALLLGLFLWAGRRP